MALREGNSERRRVLRGTASIPRLPPEFGSAESGTVRSVDLELQTR
jgi:hypothetical protein